MKTYNAKPGEIQRDWYVVDAEGQTLGRLATRIADTLRGKNKPQYTPHVDTGDFVVVVNAEKIAVTGKKLDQKLYHRHSGYPGGLRTRTLREQLERRPTEVLRKAVKGMLPRNRLARTQITKLKIYAGPEHPHEAQAPKPLKLEVESVAEQAQYMGTGKRKTSVARVILRPGDGTTWFNGRTIEEYFPRLTHRLRRSRRSRWPVSRARTTCASACTAAGPAGRPARSATASPARSSRPTRSSAIPLKREGFLTRDAREVERKKAGLHKARKAPQFSKR